MRKKVLFVIDGMEFGGGERGFAQIIHGLPAKKYDTFLASGPQETFYNAIAGKPVQRYHVDFSNRYNLSALIDLIRIIRSNHINIVHGQGTRADFYARIASGLSRKSKYISTVQMPVEGYDVSHLKSLLYRVFDRFSERFVDRFIVVSDSLMKSIVQTHGIPAERVVKIHNGIEIDIYRAEDQFQNRFNVRHEFQISDGDLLVGAIGRLVWQKGFEYFIRAIPDLVNTLPKSRFFLIGDGILRRDLEALAASLGLGKHLVFTGHRTDIRDILAALDVLIVPSLLEGFPMITLEAMAMAKPIVATRIDGITEQIIDGREGILIQPKSPADITRAVVRIAHDPVLASTLENAARRRVAADFSVQQMIQATMKVYDELS